MRSPIMVQIQPFNIEQVQPGIDAAREAFVRYLSAVPRKSTHSKHGLMGPVGKILSEVKTGRHDPASLTGYAIRVHEANGKPSRESLAALEEGVGRLVRLLAETPVTAHERVLDRLDYGLYYDLRKQAIEAKEARRQAWIRFVREKYGNEIGLSKAWGEEVASLDDLYLPRKAEGSRGRKATVKQQDVAAFWESQGAAMDATVEEDEE